MTHDQHRAKQVPFHHNSAEVIADDLNHLIEALHDICKTRNIPYSLVLEEALDAEGSQVQVSSYYPEERARQVGLTGRFILLRLASISDQQVVMQASNLLLKHKLITPKLLQ